MKKRICFLMPLLLLLVSCGTARQGAEATRTGIFFDTVIQVTIYHERAQELLDEAFRMAAAYEDLLSTKNEGSDIWNINHAQGEPVPVSSETVYLIQSALSFTELSGGKIDPTIAPLTELWDFSSEHTESHHVPGDSQIRERLQHVDARAISISGSDVCLTDPDAAIDLGFIAKGYIADKIKEFLLEEGVESALINLGGNVLAVGSKPDSEPFKIGIQKPFSPRGTAAAAIPVSDQSLVSSGTYERCFEEDGVLYHHILDPDTGYPAVTDLDSVTILSDSSMAGDGLSTTCLMLGLSAARELMESLEGTEALFITKDGSLHYTSGFPASISL